MFVTLAIVVDDLAAPLYDVPFCVVDVETTGTSPHQSSISEIGAIKLRGGERVGMLQTLVNPGDAGAGPAIPRDIDGVLASFTEFAWGNVLVGHNLRFDLAFLNAALTASERLPLTHPTVDTCLLARRLVRDEVPNCRLATLADRFGLEHRPTHRALDDAMATGDLLHVLLERVAGFGVLDLGELISFCAPQRTRRAPRTRGIARETA